MRIIFLDASIETARQHWAEIQGFGFLEECLRSAKVLFVDIWDEEARYMVDFEPTV